MGLHKAREDEQSEFGLWILSCPSCCPPGWVLAASIPLPGDFIPKLESLGKVVLHVKHSSTVTGEKPSNNETPQGNHLIFPAFSHGFLALGSAEGKN